MIPTVAISRGCSDILPEWKEEEIEDWEHQIHLLGRELKQTKSILVVPREFVQHIGDNLAGTREQKRLGALFSAMHAQGRLWIRSELPIFLTNGCCNPEQFSEVNSIVVAVSEVENLSSENREGWYKLFALHQKPEERFLNQESGKKIQIIRLDDEKISIIHQPSRIFKKEEPISEILSHIEPAMSWATRIKIVDGYAIFNHGKEGKRETSGLRSFFELMIENAKKTNKKWKKLEILDQTLSSQLQKEQKVEILSTLVEEMKLKEYFSKEDCKIELRFVKGSIGPRLVGFERGGSKPIWYQFDHSGLSHLGYRSTNKKRTYLEKSFKIISLEEIPQEANHFSDIKPIEI